MADVSKIKLPDNTEVNIKDSRISSIDSTPTSGSTNPVTSGGVYDSILDSIPAQAFNYTSGYLVKTNISTSLNSNFYFRIEGKGHGTDNYAVFAFGSAYYTSGGDFSYTNAYNLGTSSFGPISLFVYDGYIYIWFSQTAAYYRFWVTVYENSGKNRVDTITDAAKPSGALHNVDISPINNVKVSGTQTITGTKTFSAGTLTISSATSGTPTLVLQRGTASDGYVDHVVQSSAGALGFLRSISGTRTLQIELGSTSFYPVSTITDSVSNLSLGNSTHYWAAIYSNIGDFKGDVAIGGDLSITGGVSINGTIAASNLPTYYTGSSAPSSSLGQDGDIYLQISS